MTADKLSKTHPTEHLADVWLDWVQRHYTVTRIELSQVRDGWQATAHLDTTREDTDHG